MSTNLNGIREALFGLVKTTAAGLTPVPVLVFQNLHLVDENDQQSPFIYVSLKFTEGQQVSMESAPRTRYWGELLLFGHCREGEGTKTISTMLDGMAAGLKYQQVSGVSLMAPRPMTGGVANGWYSQALALTFYGDVF